MAPSFGLASISERVRRTSIRQGLLGGNRFWLVVFGLSHLGRWSGKLTKKGTMPIAFSERLGPGEAFEIRHVQAPNRRGRRS
jgi:hypothetical protein